nr:hypothetical protein [Tanacetum cinerariifolium]
MQQKIKRLQAQLGVLKGKSMDTSCVSNTLNPLSQKLENENTELEFQDMSKNTKFAKQPNVEILPKIGETNALSKPVTSNSVSTSQVSKGVNNAKERKFLTQLVQALGQKPITVSQPSIITKKDMNSNLNGLSSTGLDNTKTRRPQPRSNTKNDRVPSASKSSRSKNKEAKVEEHHRNLLLSKKNKHISSACNNSKIDSQDVISKVVCAVCTKSLNSVNHDVCLNNCVNGKRSRVVYDVSKKCLNSVNHDVCLNNCVNGKKSRGNLKLLINFTRKFMGTIHFGNDHVAAILGFGIGYGFLPFSFSSLGELEANAVTLMKQIRKFSMTRDIRAHAVVYICNRISFAISKRVGA